VKILSFGCSLIFGTDLSDDGRDKEYPTASQLTWPALLAKQFGASYKCHAKGGAGNLLILDRIMSSYPFGPEAIVIVGWTWTARFDYSDPQGHHFGQGKNDWLSLQPIGRSDLHRCYYQNLHSEYKDKMQSLIYIKTAIDFLNDHDVPFVMTNLDDLIFCKKFNISPGMQFVQQKVKQNLISFEGKNFIDWSRQKNFPVSDTWHPLEQAHLAAAEFMLPKLHTLLESHR
jgi:hypothetical protein